MNLRQRLDELRQLEQKATPGEWRFKQYDRIRYSLMGGHRYVMGQDVVSSPALPDDAALIAAMRYEQPRITEEARRAVDAMRCERCQVPIRKGETVRLCQMNRCPNTTNRIPERIEE